MSPISFRFAVAAVTGAALIAASVSPAAAGGFYTGSVPSVSGNVSVSGAGAPGGYGGGGGGGGCHGGGGGASTIIINKNININKPVNINKNININKNVVINKVNVERVRLRAGASPPRSAAQAGAAAQSIVYGGGSYQIINYNNHGGGGAIAIAAACRRHLPHAGSHRRQVDPCGLRLVRRPRIRRLAHDRRHLDRLRL